MEKYKFWSAGDIENQIKKYISDAARIAETGSTRGCQCALDGIIDPKSLAEEIINLGNAYTAKLKKLAQAGPVIEGDTISIYTKPQKPGLKVPSKKDQEFIGRCLRQLKEQGYVLAADADTYEKIAKEYPHIKPSRVRGAEARRYIKLSNSEALRQALKMGQ